MFKNSEILKTIENPIYFIEKILNSNWFRPTPESINSSYFDDMGFCENKDLDESKSDDFIIWLVRYNRWLVSKRFREIRQAYNIQTSDEKLDKDIRLAIEDHLKRFNKKEKQLLDSIKSGKSELKKVKEPHEMFKSIEREEVEDHAMSSIISLANMGKGNSQFSKYVDKGIEYLAPYGGKVISSISDTPIGAPFKWLVNFSNNAVENKHDRINKSIEEIRKERGLVEEHSSPYLAKAKKGKARQVKNDVKRIKKAEKKIIKEEKKIVNSLRKVPISRRGRGRKNFIRRRGGLVNQMRRLGVTMQPKVPQKGLKSQFAFASVSATEACVSGTDVLYDDIKIVPGDPGTVWNTALLNPIELPFVRLNKLAQCFAMYRFTAFAVLAYPGKGSTQTGAVVIYYDPDINDDPTNTTQGYTPANNFRDASAHKGRRVMSLNQIKLFAKLPTKIGWNQKDWYFISSFGRDPTFVYQARLTIETAVRSSDNSEITIGPWMVKWQCCFKDPQTRLPAEILPPSEDTSVFIGNTATGGNLAVDDLYFPITGTLSEYSRQVGDGVVLETHLLNQRVIAMTKNATYYFTIYYEATTPASPVISLSNSLGDYIPTYEVQLNLNGTTHGVAIGYVDVTIDNGAPDLSSSTSDHFIMYIENKSTACTSYTVMCTSDSRSHLAAYAQPELSKNKEISWLQKKLISLENKDKIRPTIFDKILIKNEVKEKKKIEIDEKVKQQIEIDFQSSDDEKETVIPVKGKKMQRVLAPPGGFLVIEQEDRKDEVKRDKSVERKDKK